VVYIDGFGMAEDWSGQPKLSGTVESDETYVRGKPRYPQPHKGPAKGWLDRKTPVVSLVECGGKIRSFVTTDVTAANLGKILQDNVARESHLMTDSSPVYTRSQVGKPFVRHSMTDHHLWRIRKAGLDAHQHSRINFLAAEARHLRNFPQRQPQAPASLRCGV
jgi:ISXO2 transposase-like protein